MIDDAQNNAGEMKGVTRFTLWADQIRLMGVLATQKFVQILKARQLGISWCVCAYVLWKVLFHPGQVVLLLSKGQLEANELLRRVKALYERLPGWMKEALPQVRPDVNNRSEWGLTNGSVVRSLPARENSGISFTASLVVMDEAAHQKWGGVLFANVKPTIDDGGPNAQMVVLSTANGIGDFFHNLWTKTAEGVNGFFGVFLPWWSRPGRDEAWYARIVREAEEPALVPQNYPANPIEAFVSSSRTRFDSKSVASQMANVEEPLWRTDPHHGGIVPGPGGEWPSALLARYGWRGWDTGEIPDLPAVPGLTIYRAPEPGQIYLIGGDVAEGLEDGDWDHAVVINARTWEEVACLHGRWETDVYADYLMALSEPYKAPVVVERNNHGHAVLGRMKRVHFPRVALGEDDRPGWLTTKKNKPEGASFLSEALNKRQMTVRSRATVHELQVYSRLGGGGLGAPPGYNDDRVMAWMAALGRARLDALGQGVTKARKGRNPLAGYRGR